MIKVTYDELLAKIDTLEARYTDYPSYLALRAVVELHKPCEPVSDDKFVTCETCNYEYHREYPYPCETFQLIVEKLG